MNVDANKKPKDLRPRIIRNEPILKGINIAARQSILWPCHTFQISVPQRKSGELNILEEVIFKLAVISTSDTDKLVKLTCLEKDLVVFIQNRLVHMNLLDSRYEPTEEGQSYYKDTYLKPIREYEYTSARVFVDILNGRILPYIQSGPPEFCRIHSIESGLVNVILGSSGKEKTIKARQIMPDKHSYWDMIPSALDIVKAIRDYKRRYRHHVILNPDLGQLPMFIPRAEAMTVQNQPELVYLLCDMIVQEGNADIIVTDGIGLGFSEIFAEYIMRQNSPWVTEFKKRGVKERIEIVGGVEQQPRINYRYPQVTNKFIDSQDLKYLGIHSLLRKTSKAPETASEEREYISQKQQIATKLHEAIEWSLRYVVSDYPVDEWTQLFETQNYQNNKQILIGTAKKVGFNITDKATQVLNVKAGAIRQLSMGSVNLQPLLALSIIGAANKYKSHPFNNLAIEIPNSLDYISHVKSMRDPVLHGEINDYSGDYQKLKVIVDRCKDIIKLILPMISSELLDDNTSTNGHTVDTNQDRLKAEIEIEKILGTSFMYSVDPDIKELLVRCELMIMNYSIDNAYVVVNYLCSSIQATIAKIIKGNNAIVEQSDFIDNAVSRMVSCGFFPDHDSVPKAYTTVRADRLRRSVYGGSETLGSDVLALMITSPETELKRLQAVDPSSLHLVASLITLREHGNVNKRELTLSDVTELAEKVFKIIKTLKEIF